MFEHIRQNTVASFKLGKEKFELVPVKMKKSADSYLAKVKDGLIAILNFEKVAENYYHWYVILKNDGTSRTEQITEFYGIDLKFGISGEARWESITGDTCGIDSFMPLEEDFYDGKEIKLDAVEGRSSQGNTFPYFDVTSDSGSAIFAIGWTGQWTYSLTRTGDEGHLCAGFADCDFYLEPGESARSCGALVYSGDILIKTRQDFRRIFRKRLSPAAKYGGKIDVPLSFQVFDRYFWTRPSWATEEEQIKCVDSAERCGYFDTYWLDAAWFREGFPNGVGNYSFAGGFPNGLGGVSEHAHNKGLKFMLWFEPERNHENSETVAEHPEFMLGNGNPDNKNRLYNLSDEKAFEWLRDRLISMIRENGIDIYRQDFNMDPLSYWRYNDTECRKGYTENKYITNLYRLWDALHTEFPGLMIDNCSSGGRRLDFEMNMRALPLWRSDTGCSPASDERPAYVFHQNQTLGLSRYLPYHTTASWTAEANTFRSAATMGIACTFDVLNETFDYEEPKQPLSEFVSLRHYWDGDFYPLTCAAKELDVWCAYQLALPDSGFCAFFRRSANEERIKIFKLNAVMPDCEYEVSVTDNSYCKTTKRMYGKEFSEFHAVIENKNESLILEYKAVK